MEATSSMSNDADAAARAAARRPSEFALTVPMFFLFLMASFEFGWLNVMRHTADNAAYEAARYAMVPGGTAAEAKAKANAILNIVGARGAKVTVTPGHADHDDRRGDRGDRHPDEEQRADRAAVHRQEDAAQRSDAADRAGASEPPADRKRCASDGKPRASSIECAGSGTATDRAAAAGSGRSGSSRP